MAFGGQDFNEDPFFRTSSGFPGFRDPFMDMMAPRSLLPPAPLSQRQRSTMGQQLVERDPFMFPFGGLSPFSMFRDMERMMHEVPSEATHSYSSSSVMHFSSGGPGQQPRVYHASSSTRQAPGGIKETRKSVKDSTSGVQRVSIGHQIGDRSHTIARHYNAHTKEKEEHQEFINLDETDSHSFNEEWLQKTRSSHQQLLGPTVSAPRRALTQREHTHTHSHPQHHPHTHSHTHPHTHSTPHTHTHQEEPPTSIPTPFSGKHKHQSFSSGTNPTHHAHSSKPSHSVHFDPGLATTDSRSHTRTHPYSSPTHFHPSNPRPHGSPHPHGSGVIRGSSSKKGKQSTFSGQSSYKA